jgi:hypothetical protein
MAWKKFIGLQCRASNGNWGFDRWMRVVANQFKVFIFEIVYVFHGWIEFHLRQRARLALKLQAGLFDVI